MEYDFEHDRVAAEIKENGWKSVVIQFPEGLKMRAFEVERELKKRGVKNILISGDPCFGACDLALAPISLRGADGLVHYGHSPIPAIDPGNVIYVELRAEAPVEEVVEKAVTFLEEAGYEKDTKVGLLASIQHIHTIETASEIISRRYACTINEGDRRISHAGQVLGCNFSAARSADADVYIFIGSGKFHAIGASMATGKEVIVADPYTLQVSSVKEDVERTLRRRFGQITAASSTRVIGILAGTKIGQWRMATALRMKKLIEESGREAHIIAMNFFSPEQMNAFRVDAWVNTACPRIPVDESMRYAVPHLTPPEMEIVLGLRKWEDYVFDEIEG